MTKRLVFLRNAGIKYAADIRPHYPFLDEGKDMNSSDTLRTILKKNWQDRDISDVMQASPSVLKGIDATTAKMLEDHFGIKSVLDMARNKQFLFARMLEIVSLQDGAERHKIKDSGFMRTDALIEV